MSPQEERFYYLAEKSLDEQLNSNEQFELDDLLKKDEDLKELYFQLRHQHAELSLDPRVAGPAVPNPTELDFVSSQQPPKPSNSYLWKIVATVACMIALWTLSQTSRSSKTIATLEQTDACIWEGGSLPTLAGSDLQAGMLKLKQGHARLKFDSGAVLKLEGPVTLELIDEMNCTLHLGTLVAEVPPSAHLFTVNTPKAEIIDLGTSFSLNVNSTGDSMVHVLDGEIKAQALGTKTSQLLTAGQGIEVSGQNQVTLYENMLNEWDSLKIKNKDNTKFHTIKVRTDHGQGDDTYVFSQVHKNVSETILLIKNGDGSHTRFMRHAFMKFDVNNLPKEELLNATLQLQFLHTGFGVGVDLADSEFKVFALVQEEFDTWRYPKLKWENAPAHLEHSLKNELVKEIATFTVPRGRENGLYEVTSPELIDLIQNDSNRIINLIIIRSTSGNHSSTDTLVHGIASRRHPTAQAPTLKLDFKPPHQI